MTTSEGTVTFADFRLDASNVSLWRGKQALKLKPKAFDVLHYLVDHAGQVVTKDALWRAIWLDVTVSDAVLTMCVRELRQALEDDAKAPRFIETVHRRGYRFIGQVVSSQHSVVSSRQTEGRSLATQHSALSPQHSALVGRETELSQLHRWLDKALNGERQLVFVTGEPGIGKTALVETFLMHLDAVDTLWLGRGQCIEHYGAGEPYLPVLQALSELGGRADRDYFLTVLRQHAPSWLVQLPALVSPTERETLQRQTTGVTRERMLRELVEALAVLTAEQGVVLFLEDLHWSDPSTVELLALLARRQAPARLLVVGTYRPVDVIVIDHPLKAAKQELQMHGQCQELPLPLLSETAVEEYLAAQVSAAAQATTPLQPLARLIHQRTDGNPLFMVTVVEQVLMQRAADPALAETSHIRIPTTIRQLIEEQVGRLDPQDQRLLDAASVVGTEFSAAAVAAAIKDDILTVEGRCEQLARRGTVLQVRGTMEWPDGTVAGRYGFLHALYQDVLYTRLPAAQRVHLHHQVGEREEQAYGVRAAEIASELAVHFEYGRDYRKAVRYLQQAGENALRRNAYQEAINHFTKGLELLKTLPDTPDRVQHELTLQLALRDAQLPITGYLAPEVEKTVLRARELCRQLEETPQLVPVLLRLWSFYYNRGEVQTARELAEQMMRLAQSVQDRFLLSGAHMALGFTLYLRGEFASARPHLEQASALYDPQTHPRSTVHTADPRVQCLSCAAWTLWYLGCPDQALKRSQEAVALAAGLSHPWSRIVALGFAALFHLFRREDQLARERAEAVITLATEQGFPYWLALGTMVRGWALVEQGQVQEGITQMRQSQMSSLAPYVLAEAYGKVGQVEEGLSILAEALAFVDKTGVRVSEAELYRVKGTLTLQSKVQGPKSKVEEEAEACFHKAIEIARQQQAKSLELRAVMSLARLWQQQGKRAEAHQLLAAIYNWFTEGFDTKDLQEAKALLEELS